MAVLRIDPRAVDEAGVRAWAALAARAVEPNAFYRPEFLLANVIERAVPVELLVVVDGDRWIACLPVRALPASTRFPSLVPVLLFGNAAARRLRTALASRGGGPRSHPAPRSDQADEG